MSVLRLILREIRYRKVNFALSTLAVVVAVACVVTQVVALDRHDAATESIIAAKQAETSSRTKQLEDDYRRMSLKMGFNILIVPKDQNLGDLYVDDFASKYMPEDYADRLARQRVATINHVLPSLHEKYKWPERSRTVLLVGVRGEAYIQSKKQKPLLEAVPEGAMVIGHELATSLGLTVGQDVPLAGRTFKLSKIEPERGNKDDITVWIHLSQAQEILNRPKQINAILALECNCTKDRLALIRQEIAAILPDTQVLEFASQALMRAEARNRATAEATAAVEAEQIARASLRDERERFASLAAPLVAAACALGVALLAWMNVRERAGEIGILRAIGLGRWQISLLLLGKALVVGLCGAALGMVVGALLGAWPLDGITPVAAAVSAAAPSFELRPLATDFVTRLATVAMIAAPIVVMLASWLPAMLAARLDPADVLREE